LESREETFWNEELLERMNNMQNQKATPETDANAECDQEDGSPFAPVREWVHADFARRLERDRDTNRQLYETECKDHAFMRKTLNRVIMERDQIHAALVKLDGIMRHEMGNHGFRPDWLRDAISWQNTKDQERIASPASDCSEI